MVKAGHNLQPSVRATKS